MKKSLLSLIVVFMLFACSDSKDSGSTALSLEGKMQQIIEQKLVKNETIEITLDKAGFDNKGSGVITNPRNTFVRLRSLDEFFNEIIGDGYYSSALYPISTTYPDTYPYYPTVPFAANEKKTVEFNLYKGEALNNYTVTAFLTKKELNDVDKLFNRGEDNLTGDNLTEEEYNNAVEQMINMIEPNIRVYKVIYK